MLAGQARDLQMRTEVRARCASWLVPACFRSREAVQGRQGGGRDQTVMDNSACLYVRGPASTKELGDLIVATLGGHRDGSMTVIGQGWEADCEKNDDAGNGPPDDFLYWPLVVYYDPDDTLPHEVSVAHISTLLQALWACGFDVVTAADYESELPYSGGWSEEGYTFPQSGPSSTK